MIDKRKRKLDSVEHFSRPELLSLLVERRPNSHMHDRGDITAADISINPTGTDS
jgi:nitrilase